MRKSKKYTPRVIYWDFDGVILNSNEIRELGFKNVLKDFPKDEVEKLLEFHNKNGGLSRYVKFRYFFEGIRNETVTNDIVNAYANSFSEIMLGMLGNKSLLINEVVNFITENHSNYTMYIVSGSDEKELRTLCNTLGITNYFISIHGSPKPKKDIIKENININNYKPNDCVLIGDSINDFEAATENGINFLAYNNPSLDSLTNVNFSITS